MSSLAIIQKSNLFSFIDSNIPGFSQQTKQLKHTTEYLLQQLIWPLPHFFPPPPKKLTQKPKQARKQKNHTHKKEKNKKQQKYIKTQPVF